jgi:hypothetical protein
MRLSLLLIGTAYLSLGLGSAQACSVKFETGTGIASPARFALLWPERDQARVMGRFFVLVKSQRPCKRTSLRTRNIALIGTPLNPFGAIGNPIVRGLSGRMESALVM